jgi:hypothetical protein
LKNPFSPEDPVTEAEWELARKLALKLAASVMAARWGLVNRRGVINLERCRYFIERTPNLNNHGQELTPTRHDSHQDPRAAAS